METRIPAWGLLALMISALALGTSEKNLVYTALFLTLFGLALVTGKRFGITTRTEYLVSFIALLPLVLEQLFTDTHILNSFAHCLLFMSVIKVYKKKTARDVYIIYFTGFAILVLAASTTTNNLVAVPIAAYAVCTGLALRQSIFGRESGNLSGRFLTLGAFGVSLGLATLMALGLPSLQRSIEFSFADYLSGQISIYSAFSGRSHFGDIGEMKMNNRVVLRMISKKPELLKGKIFIRYTPQGWRSDATKSREVLPDAWVEKSAYSPDFPENDGEYFSFVPFQKFMGQPVSAMKILMGTQTHRTLFAPYNTIGLQCHLQAVYGDRHGSIYRKASLKGIEYTAYYLADDKKVFMKGSRLLVPGAFLDTEEALDIPNDLEPSIKELSTFFAGDETDPYKKARLMTAGLKNYCGYSTVLSYSDTVDPVLHFLYERKEGNCEMFASALALMFRAQGIPSRYVTGFQTIEKNRLGGYYIVRERDAHAWTEAYFPEYGWIPFDATPSGMDAASGKGLFGARISDVLDFLRMKSQEMGFKARTLGFTEFLGWTKTQLALLLSFVLKNAGKAIMPGLFLVLAVLVYIRVRSRKRKPAPISENDPVSVPMLYELVKKDGQDLATLHRLLEEYEAFLKPAGITREDSQTFQEYIASVPDENVNKQITNYGHQLLSLYHACRFGNITINTEELECLSRQWTKLTAVPE